MALHANKIPNAICQLERCIGPLSDILNRYDTVHDSESPKCSHKPPKTEKDL